MGENEQAHLPGTAVLMLRLKMVITSGVFQGQKPYIRKAAEYFLASLKPLLKTTFNRSNTTVEVDLAKNKHEENT